MKEIINAFIAYNYSYKQLGFIKNIPNISDIFGDLLHFEENKSSLLKSWGYWKIICNVIQAFADNMTEFTKEIFVVISLINIWLSNFIGPELFSLIKQDIMFSVLRKFIESYIVLLSIKLLIISALFLYKDIKIKLCQLCSCIK